MEAILGTEMIPSANKLKALATGAARLHAVEQEIAALQKRMKELEDEQKTLSRRTLPDLFDEVNLDRVGVPDALVDVVVENKYFANIPADWDEDRRNAAFDLVEEYGGGDMVTTVVSVAFGKGEKAVAEELKRRLEGLNWLEGRSVTLKQGIHWGTMSSWLREMYESEESRKIPLEPINGDVGRVCKIKPRKTASNRKKGK
jgi:hypothetical protein